MKTKISKEMFGLILLILIFVVAGFFVAAPNGESIRTVGEELSADPSIYNDRASGSKALFDWTKQLGYHPSVAQADWQNLPNTSSLMISIAPDSVQGFDLMGEGSDDEGDSTGNLTADDARGMESWLRSGRTLLLLTSRLPVNTLFARHSTSTGGADGDDEDDDSNKSTFGDVLGLAVESTQEGNQTDFVPLQPGPLAAGVDSIRLSDGGSRIARKRRDGEVLFATLSSRPGNVAIVAPAVMAFPEGKGRVIVVSDDYFASNRNLSQADNAAFIANVIATSVRPGGRILFDEYHHGGSSNSSSLWSAMGRPMQAATWQLLLVCLLVLAMAVPRFGAIKRLRRDDTRATGEYLTSLAGLYQRANATVPALEIIYKQFLRDLCERLALPPGVPLEKLAEAAARNSKIKPESVKRLIIACETALDRRQLSSSDLLVMTRQMEQIKRQLSRW